jgi:hypothetical protein
MSNTTYVPDFNIADVSEVYIQRNPDGTFRISWESMIGGSHSMSGFIPRAKIEINVVAIGNES